MWELWELQFKLRLQWGHSQTISVVETQMGKGTTEGNTGLIILSNRFYQEYQSHADHLKTCLRPGAVAHAYNPSSLGSQGRWITRSRDRDHPGQQGETPSLLKIQKLAGHGGARL